MDIIKRILSYTLILLGGIPLLGLIVLFVLGVIGLILSMIVGSILAIPLLALIVFGVYFSEDGEVHFNFINISSRD